jgi:competence protein ComEC
LLLLAFFFGFFYYYFYLNFTSLEGGAPPLGVPVKAVGVVTVEPRVRTRSQEFILALRPPYRARIRVVAPRIPEFRYGDVLRIAGVLEPPEDASPRYREPKAVFPEIQKIASGEGSRVKAGLLAVKQSVIAVFRQILPSEAAALLAGLTFGSEADMSQELKARMKQSGTTHLVALSGYNISILVLAVAAALRFYVSRRMKFFLTAATIALFVLMVGGEASVVRAALMGAVALAAREAGRLYEPVQAILLVAVFMVLVDPRILVFDRGFVLSFAALLGIVYLEPALREALSVLRRKLGRLTLRLRGGTGFLGWREHFMTTLAAQLAVLPLLVQFFGEFSLASLLANVLILEFVPLTMALGFLLGAVGLLFFPLGALLGSLVSLLLAYELGVIAVFAAAELPIRGGLFILPGMLLYYGAFIGLVVWYERRKRASRYVP